MLRLKQTSTLILRRAWFPFTSASHSNCFFPTFKKSLVLFNFFHYKYNLMYTPTCTIATMVLGIEPRACRLTLKSVN